MALGEEGKGEEAKTDSPADKKVGHLERLK